MLLRPHRPRRRGTTVVESAIVYPLVLLFTIGLGVVGFGVFRQFQVAELAREGARYASVHGKLWATDFNTSGGTTTLTTRDDVYNHGIVPYAAGLSSSQLANTDVTVSWDDTAQGATTSGGKTNMVTVTVNYRWSPTAYLSGMTLTSTSKVPISY